MSLSRRVPQDLSFPLFDADALLNLRAFIKRCILPDLDHSDYDGPFYKTRIDPQKYPNSLQIRPESWRLLELIRPIPSQWSSAWLSWLDSYIPSTPVIATNIRHRIDAQLTPLTEIPQLYAYKPGKISSQIAWMNLALVSATQIVHHSFPALRGWAFSRRRHNRSIDFDEKIFAEFHWCRAQRHPQDNEKKITLVIAIQPHWVLDEHDMDQFVGCTAYPTFSGGINLNPSESEINNKYKIWSKIWDACVQAKTDRFVLSNYKQWVFGGFSKGYRVGFVSPIYQYNNPSPTIVELLTYWIASSARLVGTYKMPKVLEPLMYNTVQIGRSNNALGCNVKSDVAWGQTNGGPDCLLQPLEESDTQSQWSDEGSVASEFEPCDTDRQEIVEGWVMDQASDGHQERSYPNPVFKRSFHFVEPMIEDLCGDWLI